MESAYHALGGIGRGKKRLRNCDSWRRCGGEVLVTSRAEARVCPRGAKSATADANLYDAYFGSTSWTQTATRSRIDPSASEATTFGRER